MAWQELTVEFSPTTNPLQVPVWVDITPYVVTCDWERGRSDELSQFTAGQATIVLRNDDRRFDPSYTAGPYYGNLLPKRRFRIRRGSKNLFTGFCTGFPQQVHYREERIFTTIECTDLFEALANQSATESSYFTVVQQYWNTNAPELWYRFKNPENGIKNSGSKGGAWDGALNPAIPIPSTGDGPTTETVGIAGNNEVFVRGPVLSSLMTNPNAFTFGFWFKGERALTENEYGTALFGPEGFPAAPPGTFPNYTGGISANVIKSRPESLAGGGPAGSLNITIGYRNLTTNATGGLFFYTDNLCDNQWHFIYVIASNNGAYLYVDADFKEFKTPGSNPPYAIDVGNTQHNLIFLRGHAQGAATPLAPEYQIAEFMTFNTEINQTQMVAYYNAAKGFPTNFTGGRMQRILQLAGFSGLDWSMGWGTVYIQDQPEMSSDYLSLAQQVAATENGIFFVNGDGKFVFKDRFFYWTDPVAANVQFTFGDSGIDFRYTDAIAENDDRYIFNYAEVSRRGSETFVARNPASIAKYFTRGAPGASDLLMTTDYHAIALAEHLANAYAEPKFRVTKLELNAKTSVNTTTIMETLEIGHRVKVRRNPNGLGQWEVTGIVDHLSHSVSFAEREWVANYRINPPPADAVMILDDPTYGNLDGYPLGY